MTMGLGFIANNIAFLAADKRTTEINNDGSNGEYTDNTCKILKISESVLLFAGGLTQASHAFTRKIKDKFDGIIQLSSKDLDVISQICKQEYYTCMETVPENLKNSSWLKDYILSVIIAENGNNGPRLIRFDIEENFSPVIQSNQGALCLKSAISPEVFWPEIQAISTELQKSGVFNPFNFIDEIFIKASEMDSAISRAYDIFYMSKPSQEKLYCQKITGGTIEATISMKSPIIYGGAIIGSSINIGNNKFVVDTEGNVTAANANITGGSITSNSTINVVTNATIGEKLNINNGYSGGIQFAGKDAIYLDPFSLVITANGKGLNLYGSALKFNESEVLTTASTIYAKFA